MSTTDNFNVAALQAGDPETFRLFVRTYGPTVRAWLGNHLADREQVTELAQETFIAAWDSLHRFDPETSLIAWLLGIARNRLRNHYRSSKRRSSAMERYRDELVTLLGGSDRIRSEQERGALRSCLDQLPERSLAVIRARYNEQLSVSDVADSHAMEPNAVRQLLHRSRLNLRRCIQQQVAW